MENESDLLRLASALDTSALAAIFDTYYDSIYRYIYCYVYHIETAEDLAAKVFQRLLENLHAGQGPKQNLKAWLYRVAYHLIIDDSRRQRYRNHIPLEENLTADTQHLEDQVNTRLLTQKVYSALSQLTEKQRDVITLRYLAGMTPLEIAGVLDTTVGSVKALQHRGLEALRRELALVEQKDNQNG